MFSFGKNYLRCISNNKKETKDAALYLLLYNTKTWILLIHVCANKYVSHCVPTKSTRSIIKTQRSVGVLVVATSEAKRLESSRLIVVVLLSLDNDCSTVSVNVLICML